MGLLLGGFPLLISAAEHYREGFEPLVKWYRFRDDFIQFIDAVATQKLLFDQTLERFLISADIPDEELQQFMSNSHYEGWHRVKLSGLLKKRLGRAHEVFLSTIKRMNKLLLELQEMLMVKTVKNGAIRISNKSRNLRSLCAGGMGSLMGKGWSKPLDILNEANMS